MQCPGCRGDLHAIEVAGVTLDVCDDCAGIWFDEGELGSLIHSRSDISEVDLGFQPHERHVQVSSPNRLCPKCDTGLESYQYMYASPVQLDSCHKCGGIFVEDGELMAIADVQRKAKSGEAKGAMARVAAAELDMQIHENRSRAFALSRAVFRNRSLGNPWYNIDLGNGL